MKIAHYAGIVAVALFAAPVLEAQDTTQARDTSRARAGSGAPPGPTAEHRKLNFFAGKWSETGELKPGPMGPGGQTTSESTCEWFPGGFHLVCRGRGTSPAGATQGLYILGYDMLRNRFTFYGIDNAGMAGDVSYGTVSGDTWTWQAEPAPTDTPTQLRYVIKQSSPTEYTWLWEMSTEAGQWTTVGEGKAKKGTAAGAGAPNRQQ